MKPTVWVFVHATQGEPRLVADVYERLLATTRGDLATETTMALVRDKGYDDVAPLKRTPDQLADAMLANGVKPEQMEERLLFVESVGDDTASAGERAATAAALVPEVGK